MTQIKKLIPLILISFFLSCNENEKKNSENYFNLKWNNGEVVVIEKGSVRSYTHFDISQNKMVGDTLIPIKINDSTIIVTEIVGNGKSVEIDGKYEFKTESDTIYTDTLRFEFRNFNGPKLLLYEERSFYPSVFNLDKSGNQEISEIKHFENIRFEIGGLSIGDTIDREHFNFGDVSNYDEYSLEEAELKSNEDIDFEIIGDKYILKIIQRGISKYDLEDIIKVVSTKLNQEPEHTPTYQGKNHEMEYYDWDKNGVDISLSRYKYTGNDTFLKMLSNDDWTLYYQDKILESLLINEFKNGQPKSSIIK